MVLHNISDDTKLVKITTTPLGSKRFLEGYLDIVYVVSVPRGAKELVAKSEDEDILDHLLSEVVVDSEQFIFLPVRLQRLLQFSGASQILAKRLFNL